MGNVFSLNGDKADIGIFGFIIYSLVPLLGQFMMRVNALGGSLDKLWLFFPLFLIPPFSIIPVVLAKMGYIKHTGAKPPIDIYILIPILFRFIFVTFILASTATVTDDIIQCGAILGAILLANIIHNITAIDCANIKIDYLKRIIKVISDSLIQYASGTLGTFIVLFIPFIGQILKVIQILPIPYIGEIIETLAWGVGIISGYLAINMVDVNFVSKTDYCMGKMDSMRLIIGCILMIVAILYEQKKRLFT